MTQQRHCLHIHSAHPSFAINKAPVQLHVLVGQGRIKVGAQTGHDVDRVLHGPTCACE